MMIRKDEQPGKREEPERRAEDQAARLSGVRPGDCLYYKGASGVSHAKVVCHGKDGATLDVDGAYTPVRWTDILGHRERVGYGARVVDQGEDGAIIEDDNGERSFLGGFGMDEEEEKEPELATAWDKAIEPDQTLAKSMKPILFFFKAVGQTIANRPGLVLQQVTDAGGHSVHRWKRTGPPQQGVKVGHRVSFDGGGQIHSGRVVASGQHGVTVQDERGAHHQVEHGDYRPHGGVSQEKERKQAASKPAQKGEPKRPAWGERNPDENDKAYAKRVVDKGESPEHLPEAHERYFNVSEGTKVVPLDKLTSTKSAEENQQGGDNGPKRMLAAYHGVLGKRDPITVTPNAKGGYDVVDGNGTYTSATKLGWSSLPVNVVDAKEAKRIKQAEAAKEAGKGKTPFEVERDEKLKKLGPRRVVPGMYHSPVPDEEMKGLPKNASQPIKENSIGALYAQAEEALTDYQRFADRIAENLGGAVYDINKKAKVDYADQGIQFIIGPIKAAARVKEKAEEEAHDEGKAEADYAAIKDIVRGTVAVDTLDQVNQVWDALTAAGVKFSRPVKDRFRDVDGKHGFACEYRDILSNIEMPNGHIAELQINVKPMLVAKEKVHKHYEEQRSIIAKAKGEDRRLSEPEKKRIDILERKQIAAYRKAWAEITHGEKFSKALQSFANWVILFPD